MEGLSLNTIPTWIVGILMLYTGYIWLITRAKKVRMDTRAIAYTLFAWGLLYLFSGIFSDSNQEEYLMIRVFMSRIVLILICLSQALPLTVSYIRGKGRDNGK